MTDQSNDNQDVTQQANAQVGSAGENSVGVTGTMGEATNVETEAPKQVAFRDSLSEELRNEPSLQNLKDINDMAKGYVHAQKELGGRVRIPGPDAAEDIKSEFDKKMEAAGYVKAPDKSNPESVKQFMTKLGAGRPESADGYVLNAPEGVDLNQEEVGTYKQVAHQLGLSQDQAHKLFEFEMTRSTQLFNSTKQAAVEGLRAQWGNEFDNKIGLAKNVLKHYEASHPEAVNDIRSNTTGNNPLVLIMAAELGKMYQESGVITGDRSVNYGLTPDEARSRIQEVQANSSHAYHNDSDPKHTAAVEEVESLYKAAYPDKG